MATAKQVNEFIKTLSKLAQKEYQKRKKAGKKWTLPSVCIAQAALETGWGTSPMMIKANAYFGIKAGTGWKGKVYSTKTQECYDGKNYTTITDLFRAYDSLEDSVADYYDLITGLDRYAAACNQTDPQKCIQAIKDGGYATSPTYVKNVMSIVKQYDLTKYDKEESTVNKETTEKDVINKVMSVARKEVGYLEKKSNSALDSKTANAGTANYTKYWRDIKPEWQGQPWCAVFVAWVLMKSFGLAMAKKLLKHWPYTYCPNMKDYFGLNANPKVGDIVIFWRGGEFAHTGIVTKVQGDRFWTIEGNTSGASGIIPNGGGVCEKSYYNSQLPGTKFCTLDWSLVGTKVDQKPVPEGSSSGKLNKAPKWVGKVTATELNVRTWPGVENETIRSWPKLLKGNLVDVCDTLKDGNGDNWYYIRIAGKYFGFVSAKYVSRT